MYGTDSKVEVIVPPMQQERGGLWPYAGVRIE